MVKIKNKRTLIALGAVGVVAIVGGTIALNYTNWVFTNVFEQGTFEQVVTETFTSPTDWRPCDTTSKTIEIKNTGTVPVSVRMALDESWVSTDGESLSLVRDGVRLASYDIGSNDWEFRDGYYYLKHDLNAGATANFLNSVTFNCDADFGEMEMCDSNGNCEGPVDKYNGASYHLLATARMKDASAPWSGYDDGYVEPKTFSLLRPDFWNVYSGQVAGNQSSYSNYKYIYYFRRSNVLPTGYPMYEMQAEGETPIYMWYQIDNDGYNYGKVYWYSTADAITWNAESGTSFGGFLSRIFANNGSIYDMSGLRDFDVHNVTSMAGFFSKDYSSIYPSRYNGADLTALSHWDVSNVASWSGFFPSGNSSFPTQEDLNDIRYWKIGGDMTAFLAGNTSITDLSPMLTWDAHPTNLNSAFTGMSNLKSLHGLENWDVSHVSNFTATFASDYKITSLEPLRDWDVSSATLMPSMFSSTYVSDASPLANWNVSNVTSFGGMFNYTKLQNSAAFSRWNVSSATDMSGMFNGCSLIDSDGFKNWNVSNVTNMSNMFYGNKFNSVDNFARWDVSSVTNFASMFQANYITNATVLNDWTVSGSATLTSMFGGNNISEGNYPTWYTSDRR